MKDQIYSSELQQVFWAQPKWLIKNGSVLILLFTIVFCFSLSFVQYHYKIACQVLFKPYNNSHDNPNLIAIVPTEKIDVYKDDGLVIKIGQHVFQARVVGYKNFRKDTIVIEIDRKTLNSLPRSQVSFEGAILVNKAFIKSVLSDE